jgi:hypothetical protein
MCYNDSVGSNQSDFVKRRRIAMREAVSEDTLRVSTSDYSIQNRVSADYILKVDAVLNNDTESEFIKSNPNPENLPAIRKQRKPANKGMILLILLFTLCFIFSVYFGYTLVFKLFEI